MLHLDIDVDVEDDQKDEWNDSVNSQVEVYQVDLHSGIGIGGIVLNHRNISSQP